MERIWLAFLDTEMKVIGKNYEWLQKRKIIHIFFLRD